MELNEYQERANSTDQRPGTGEGELMFPLMGLASEVGSLVTQFKKRVRDGDAHELFSERAAEELGDILWYVANLAAKLGLELADIAELNLRRTTERWPGPGKALPAILFDEDRPATEQLPRTASVRFREVEIDGRLKVEISSEGKPIGNPLSDMNYDDDAYRFHDVFHLTYAAMLGWSPVTRSFFDVKRESVPRVREIEDGGRAVVIEEGVSAFVFDYARQESFLERVPQLDSELLRTIASLVSHLEVRARTIAEWERAILRSYDIWRMMREHSGGTVHLDLHNRTIKYEPPHASSP
ncbi:MAG TPA: nucleoside triphosphate pyrophosphohydrolase family protein [Solirubrobacteraceae bacterium]|jgi:NTP pyrophosphatase (non-canonical NTP hydrolase)